MTSPALLQVLQLGMLDLAVDLGQRLFAAHRQYRVSEADQHQDQREIARPMCQAAIPSIRGHAEWRPQTAAAADARLLQRS